MTSFNSTLVRLRGFLAQLCPSMGSCFNSTLVRLRVSYFFYVYVVHSFQFHVGTIERAILIRTFANRSKFQFHVGTIESLPSVIELPTVVKFQFHVGTIESWLQGRETDNKQVSIPRWYDWESPAAYLCITLLRFNSTLVRLRGYTAQQRGVCVDWFQFHVGTIERKFRRLSARWYKVSIPRWYDWEPFIGPKNGIKYPSFNSTLVRLRDTPVLAPASLIAFQFHVGTIESAPATKGASTASGFQFHVGTIERYALLKILRVQFCFNSTLVRLREYTIKIVKRKY